MLMANVSRLRNCGSVVATVGWMALVRWLAPKLLWRLPLLQRAFWTLGQVWYDARLSFAKIGAGNGARIAARRHRAGGRDQDIHAISFEQGINPGVARRCLDTIASE